MMVLYVVPAEHKEAVIIGVGVDELATARHEIPETGVVIQHGDSLLCVAPEEGEQRDAAGALRAIAALVDRDFANPALDSYRDLITNFDDGPERCAVDCRAIAEAVFGKS
jgi:hypothetical protein